MLSYSTPLELLTGDAPRASVIWLHGLGANGSDFLPIVDELGVSRLPPTRFIFPHAAEQPVTLNGGYVMPSWYDIVGLHENAPEDEIGIRASVAYVTRLIDLEVQRGIAAHQIVVAGFSQGGNIALNTVLRYPQALAGALILSSYLSLQAYVEAEAHAANRHVLIFFAHGTADDVVPYALANDARACLTNLSYPVQWHEYAMSHTVCAQEISDIGDWLAKRLAS